MNDSVGSRIVLLFLISIILNTLASERTPKEYYYDVYTGRHFNSLVTSNRVNDDVIMRPAVLVLYGTECENEAMVIKQELRPYAGPMDQYLTVAFYDYDLFPRHIWFNIDAVDDLKQRYISPRDDCLKVLYFDEGSRLGNPDIWDMELPVYDWIWTKFLINVTVHNALDHEILVRKEGQGPAFLLRQLWPGESASVQTHMGLALTVTDFREKLLFGVWLERRHRFRQWVVDQALVDDFRNKLAVHMIDDSQLWSSNERYLREIESQEIESTNRGKAFNFLVAFKQPLLLPSFTRQGFSKRRIPDHVYSYLREFYDSRKAARGGVEKEMMNENNIVNVDERRTGMVELTEEVKHYVWQELQEVHEQWCQCALEGTFFYGIREYYHGNILHMHLDRVATHIISSILQIDQDLGPDGSDWPLEVIDHHGDRHFVVLKPGEMLLYESATVFHGRPTLFTGNHYANCFLHYKPRDRWPWHIHDNVFISDGAGVMEPVTVINTPGTLRGSAGRDEL